MTQPTPLRVLHVIPSIGVSRGGPSFVIRTLAAGQADYGLEVHVATTDDDGPAERASPKSIPFTEDKVTYWVFPRQSRFYLFSFPLTRWLWRNVRKYDIVHIHALFSYASVAAAVCAACARTPYIVRPLGTLNFWGMRNRRRWIKKWSFRLIERRILAGASATQYTCEQESREAQVLGVPENGIIVPNPVDLCPIQRQPSLGSAARHGLRLLFLSRLDPKKGLDLLLAAFARVRHKVPETVLVIAGSGSAEFVAILKSQSRNFGLDSSVIWAGFLQGAEKSRALEEADLFILPSYSENFGVAVVEAMGAGLPVIVSDQVGLHREVSQAGAGLVAECVVESLETSILQLISDPQLRAAMAESAAALARTFSRHAVSAQLATVYADIIASRRDKPAYAA